MSKGKVCLLISAFLYGIAPVLAKFTYTGGANGITLTFLRAAISVPLLYLIIRVDRRSLKLTKNEFKSILLLGIFGGTAPVLLLYASYNFISTGLATTLHFVYPLVIVLASAFLYHEKMSKFKLVAVVLVTVGIFLFADIETASDSAGIVLALLSGVFYSFYEHDSNRKLTSAFMKMLAYRYLVKNFELPEKLFDCFYQEVRKHETHSV